MGSVPLSAEQEKLLLACVRAGSFRSDNVNDRRRIAALHGRGLVRRHATDVDLCIPTDAGILAARSVDDALTLPAQDVGVETVPAVGSETSALVQMVERARALFDDGDTLAAKKLARGIYAEAKAAGGYASEFGAAGKKLVAKAREMQAAALTIENQALIRINEAYEAAKKEGRAAPQGRPKNIPGEKVLTQEDLGLSAKELHEARKLAQAEAREPGIIERAIAARLKAGLEPTRASVRHAIGTRTATKEARGDNLYETGPEAVRALLALETFGPVIWEPSCGRGAISRILEAAGYDVTISDINDYGTVTKDGECQGVFDFLTTAAGEGDVDIVTNPPYGAVLNAYVAHALRVHRPRKMALLLNVNFYGGTENLDRRFALTDCKPARIYWFARRLPMMHRDGWDGPEAASQMNTAWFIWERQADGSYGKQTILDRIDWKEYGAAEASAESEAA